MVLRVKIGEGPVIPVLLEPADVVQQRDNERRSFVIGSHFKRRGYAGGKGADP